MSERSGWHTLAMSRRRDARPQDEYTLLLSPGENEPLEVRFEPGGPDYSIAKGDCLRISICSPADDPIEIVSGLNWVTIWPAPTTSVRAVNANGEELSFLRTTQP
jgi:hypothetical protein